MTTTVCKMSLQNKVLGLLDGETKRLLMVIEALCQLMMLSAAVFSFVLCRY